MQYIIKADGTKEAFDQTKLERSLTHAQASPAIIARIIDHLKDEIKTTTTTAELYKHAFFLLHKFEKHAALKYSLRRAIMDLGPTGFPFEKYVARIFQDRGYTVLTDQVVRGGCVEHEVDIVAWNDAKLIMVEAKFHNELGVKTDLKVALYVKARMEDIVAAGHSNAKGLLVTNTKFTDMAKRYAECQLLELLSWDYPQGATLHERIEHAGLYPITALTTLSKREKTALLLDKVVLCNTLPAHRDILARIGVTGTKAEAVLEEVEVLRSPARDI